MGGSPRKNDSAQVEGRAERRSLTRSSLELSVRSWKKRKAVQGRGSNITERGLAAYLPLELVIGAQIKLDVVLPFAAQPLELNAVVRNRRNYIYGLEFVDVTPTQKAIINRICRILE